MNNEPTPYNEIEHIQDLLKRWTDATGSDVSIILHSDLSGQLKFANGDPISFDHVTDPPMPYRSGTGQRPPPQRPRPRPKENTRGLSNMQITMQLDTTDILQIITQHIQGRLSAYEHTQTTLDVELFNKRNETLERDEFTATVTWDIPVEVYAALVARVLMERS